MATDGKGIVKVPGVLRTNEETRQELLNRLFWEDKTYTDFGNEFVRYSEFETRQGNSLTDGLMLYDFTHGETDFAKDINRMFVPKNVSENRAPLTPWRDKKVYRNHIFSFNFSHVF